jgi:hypothetical protein
MFTSAVVSILVRYTIFRKAPPSVVSGYGERSIHLNRLLLPLKSRGDASLHTARFYELYNRSPEVDLSFKLWLSK